MRTTHRTPFDLHLETQMERVAEWGAQVGYLGADRTVFLNAISTMSDDVVSSIGVGDPITLARRRHRLNRVQTLRTNLRARTPASIMRRVAAALLLPVEAICRRRFEAAEDGVARDTDMRAKVGSHLVAWLDIHAERGRLAATIERECSDTLPRSRTA